MGSAHNITHVPTLEEIREKSFAQLGRNPCQWQARVAQEILKGENDVICVAPTGAGKTFVFWIPLLFRAGTISNS